MMKKWSQRVKHSKNVFFILFSYLYRLLIRVFGFSVYFYFSLFYIALAFTLNTFYFQDLLYNSSLDKPFLISPKLNTSDPSSALYLEIDVFLKSINPNTGNCVLAFQLNPSDALFEIISPTTKRLLMNMTLVSRNYQRSFGRETWRFIQDKYTFPFSDTSILDYPFDSHTGVLDFSAYLKNNTKRYLLPIQLSFTQTVNGYNFLDAPTALQSGPYFIQFEFTIVRSDLSIGYCISLVLLGWVLSCIIGYLALQIVFFRREVPCGLLSLPLVLLFALPSLRNAQPQKPSVGAISDTVSFLTQMSILALSAITITSTYLIRWKKNPSP